MQKYESIKIKKNENLKIQKVEMDKWKKYKKCRKYDQKEEETKIKCTSIQPAG